MSEHELLVLHALGLKLAHAYVNYISPALKDQDLGIKDRFHFICIDPEDTFKSVLIIFRIMV